MSSVFSEINYIAYTKVCAEVNTIVVSPTPVDVSSVVVFARTISYAFALGHTDTDNELPCACCSCHLIRQR